MGSDTEKAETPGDTKPWFYHRFCPRVKLKRNEVVSSGSSFTEKRGNQKEPWSKPRHVRLCAEPRPREIRAASVSNGPRPPGPWPPQLCLMSLGGFPSSIRNHPPSHPSRHGSLEATFTTCRQILLTLSQPLTLITGHCQGSSLAAHTTSSMHIVLYY